jgi:hypothetical protein
MGFSLEHACVRPVNKNLQHVPEADMFHEDSFPHCFVGLSKYLILQQSRKALAIKHRLVLGPSE